MNNDEKIEILQKRNYLVVKGNELIQKSRFSLSLPEQKTIAFICSKIKPGQTKPYKLDYEFNINDYCKVCGITHCGNNYTNVKTVLKHLRDRSMWITMQDGSETVVSWIDRVTINKGSGMVNIRIDERLAPYLFDLKQKFTNYELWNILAMKSSFSVRIYELLKSYEFKQMITFEIEELKKLLNVEDIKSYERFPDFRRKVIEPAEKEINELTDINIRYEQVTKGRKVIKVTFFIEKKEPAERWCASEMTNQKLGELK